MSAKKIPALAVALLCLTTHPLAAHGASTLPEPGHLDFSLYFGATSGLQDLIVLALNEEHEITAYGFHEVVARYNAGRPGLDMMVDIGILPWLSAGMQLNFPQLLLDGGRGGSFAPTVSVFANFQWYRSAFLGLQTRIEVEADPLFGSDEGLIFDQGFFNFYLTFVGASFTLAQRGKNALWLYADAKTMTSIENRAHRTPESSFETRLMLPPGSTAGLPHQTGPMFKVAIAPGIEWRLGWFIAHVGFNLPVVTFTQYRVGELFNFFDVDLANIEFSWRFRL
jgi:hypothetical protein